MPHAHLALHPPFPNGSTLQSPDGPRPLSFRLLPVPNEVTVGDPTWKPREKKGAPIEGYKFRCSRLTMSVALTLPDGSQATHLFFPVQQHRHLVRHPL